MVVEQENKEIKQSRFTNSANEMTRKKRADDTNGTLQITKLSH